MEPAGACQSGLPISLTGTIATVSQYQSTMQPADRFRAHLDMRKTMRLIHALLATCWAGAPLTAQTNTERIANDHYTRSHDYDLIHQRIEVSNFDWDSTSLDGRVTTTLVARRPGLDSVILDAGAKLQIRTVTAGGGGGWQRRSAGGGGGGGGGAGATFVRLVTVTHWSCSCRRRSASAIRHDS